MRLAGSIARVADSFQAFVRKWLRQRNVLLDSFTVPAAASRLWSAAAATVASAIVHRSALEPPVATRSDVRLDATNAADLAPGITLAASAATGCVDAG